MQTPIALDALGSLRVKFHSRERLTILFTLNRNRLSGYARQWCWEPLMERFSIHSIDPKLIDISMWPDVLRSQLSAEVRAAYDKRRSAIELLLLGAPRREIQRHTGVDRKSVLELFKRCITAHPDGKLYGFRALIPNTRIAPYRRRKEFVETKVGTKAGGAGAFGKLLREYPDIDEMIKRHVFQLRKRSRVYEGSVRIKSLHRRMIDMCREKGLDKAAGRQMTKQYPFNTERQGYVSLFKYVQKLIRENIEAATRANFGSDAAKSLGSGDGVDRPLLKPFQRVECDAHHIDAFFCILILSPSGEIIHKLLRRLWVIFILLGPSRVILGWQLSVREECDSNDILEAVRNALVKWEPKELRIPGLAYHADAGYPSSRNERFIGACWDEFSCDEALVNTASKVKDKLKNVVRAKPVVLMGHNPNDRAGVERVFKTIEEELFHRLPSTTGSGPDDPRRNHPEDAAIKYTIQLEDIRELIDVAVANYNSTPHEGLFFQTPLQYLELSCARMNAWPRQADPLAVEDLSSFDKKVTVRGSLQDGRGAHINLYGARYSSDTFKHAAALIGKQIVARIDRREMRTVRIFEINGSELGVLRAASPWHRFPHSLEMRQEIRRLIKRKILHYTDSQDLGIVYLDYLEQKAMKNKYVEPAYLEARRVMFGTGSKAVEWMTDSSPVRNRPFEDGQPPNAISIMTEPPRTPRKAVNL